MLSYWTVFGQVKLRLICLLLWINNNKRAFPNQFKTLNDSVNMCEGVAAKLLVDIDELFKNISSYLVTRDKTLTSVPAKLQYQQQSQWQQQLQLELQYQQQFQCQHQLQQYSPISNFSQSSYFSVSNFL